MRKNTPREDKKPSLYSLSGLPSGELIQRLKRLVARQGELTAQVLAHVGEVDARKLYLRAACSSMFAYCTDVLKLSEGATYKRICAARAARQHPALFELVASGELHLSAVCLLAPHLTAANCGALLGEASGCSKRQVEKLLARLFPKPDVDTTVRALPRRRDTGVAQPSSGPPKGVSGELPLLSRSSKPTTRPAPASGGEVGAIKECGDKVPAASGEPTVAGARAVATVVPGQDQPSPRGEPDGSTAPGAAPVARRRRDVMSPLSERRYKIQLTAGQSLHDKLKQAQQLLGDQVAPGDLAAVFEQGLDLLIRDLRRKRFAETDRPRRPTKGKRPPSGSPSRPDGAEAPSRLATAPSPPEPPASSMSGGAAPKEPARDGGGRRSRYIPADVRRTVARRDGYQCTFVDPNSGRRCPERSDLQYHHGHPWARGGSREASNISLLCGPHNRYLAEQDFGAEHIARRVHQTRQSGKARRAEAIAGGDVVAGDAAGSAEPAAAPPGRSP